MVAVTAAAVTVVPMAVTAVTAAAVVAMPAAAVTVVPMAMVVAGHPAGDQLAGEGTAPPPGGPGRWRRSRPRRRAPGRSPSHPPMPPVRG